MAQDKFLSLLGICRAAGRLQWGHDACLQSVLRGGAKLCLLASDASERLHREFRRAAADHDTAVLETHFTMQQFSDATGCRAGVLTTEDEGFAKKLAALYPNCIKGGLTAYDQ